MTQITLILKKGKMIGVFYSDNSDFLKEVMQSIRMVISRISNLTCDVIVIDNSESLLSTWRRLPQFEDAIQPRRQTPTLSVKENAMTDGNMRPIFASTLAFHEADLDAMHPGARNYFAHTVPGYAQVPHTEPRPTSIDRLAELQSQTLDALRVDTGPLNAFERELANMDVCVDHGAQISIKPLEGTGLVQVETTKPAPLLAKAIRDFENPTEVWDENNVRGPRVSGVKRSSKPSNLSAVRLAMGKVASSAPVAAEKPKEPDYDKLIDDFYSWAKHRGRRLDWLHFDLLINALRNKSSFNTAIYRIGVHQDNASRTIRVTLEVVRRSLDDPSYVLIMSKNRKQERLRKVKLKHYPFKNFGSKRMAYYWNWNW